MTSWENDLSLPQHDNFKLGILASAYRESLKVAAESNLKSVSFPAKSTGVYGYPVTEAARVVVKTVADFLKKQNHLG